MKEATAALKTEAAATADKIKLYPCNRNDNIALGGSYGLILAIGSCNLYGFAAGKPFAVILFSFDLQYILFKGPCPLIPKSVTL